MPLSESRKRANKKYNAKTYTIVACTVRKDDAAEFKAACKEEGTTPNAIFKAAMEDFMREYRKKHPEKQTDGIGSDVGEEPIEDGPE